jgi:hypothetical protein
VIMMADARPENLLSPSILVALPLRPNITRIYLSPVPISRSVFICRGSKDQTQFPPI